MSIEQPSPSIEDAVRLGVTAIPCTLIRGGTSRGAFFNAADLPNDTAERDRVLLAALGSPHPLQVDGIGGGNPLTSKVAIVARSDDPRADVDYTFAQITPERDTVDTNSACGNILSAVGPFAVQEGLVELGSPVTQVRIRDTNSDTITLATLKTPGGQLCYDRDEPMVGTTCPSAPIRLSFLDAAGAFTDHLLPTGKVKEEINGIEVSLIDYAIPVLIIDARKLGLSGDESVEQIDGNTSLFETIEAIRLEAGRRMGLGDVSKSVVPKVALISPARNGGTITSRYLMPWRCHLTHAVTGGLCLSAAIGTQGSVAHAVAPSSDNAERKITIEHPTGVLNVEITNEGDRLVASVTRTARILFRGHVYVPMAAVPAGEAAGIGSATASVQNETDQPDKKTVLLIGNYRPTLGAARALGRMGYRVVLGAEPDSSGAERSRFVDEIWPLPATELGPDAFRRALAERLQSDPSVGFILPMRECKIKLVDASRDIVPADVLIATPQHEALKICLDKLQWLHFCRDAGIPCPAFGAAGSILELRRVVNEIGCPLVVRPVAGGKRIWHRKAITIERATDFDKVFPRWPSDGGELLAQRRFEGERYNVYFAAREGKIICELHSYSLRTDRIDGSGQTIEGKIVPAVPVHSSMLAKAAEGMNYTGIGNAQFLHDVETGQSCFLEINPRFGGSHSFVEYSGFDQTRLALELARPGYEPLPPEAVKPVHFVWTYGDLYGLMFSLKAGDVTKKQALRWLLASVRAAILSDVHVTWSWRDPLPTLGIIWERLSRAVGIGREQQVANRHKTCSRDQV